MSDIEITIKANITKKIKIPSFKATATFATLFISLLLSVGGNTNVQPAGDKKNDSSNQLASATPEQQKVKKTGTVSDTQKSNP